MRLSRAGETKGVLDETARPTLAQHQVNLPIAAAQAGEQRQAPAEQNRCQRHCHLLDQALLQEGADRLAAIDVNASCLPILGLQSNHQLLQALAREALGHLLQRAVWERFPLLLLLQEMCIARQHDDRLVVRPSCKRHRADLFETLAAHDYYAVLVLERCPPQIISGRNRLVRFVQPVDLAVLTSNKAVHARADEHKARH
mmetsp:Transcript_95621/g.292419  ORF Transcript_95621/g.292419 Transcript_95621/m.292419 type:complete len:200 (-) Transcript_95621:111-710(-)